VLVTLHPADANHHHDNRTRSADRPRTDNKTRVMVMTLLAAVVFVGVRAVADTEDSPLTPPADQTRPNILDPTGLGAALSVVYEPNGTRPSIVDPTGLGAALSVVYGTLPSGR
jgi:hypothetical protein